MRDITERKQAEERQALLTQEIAHRGKNLLAVIQSIAGQILSNARSPEEAKDALLRRIPSLSRTYNTLTGSAWEGAEISKLVHDELGPFVAQAEIAGPRIKVHPKAAQTLALTIHELATNAAKYGALSASRGGVSVTWSIEGDPGDQTFSFRWQERGGPPVQSPTRRGFGALITDHVVAFEFGTTPLHEYAADGVRYEFTTALSEVAGQALSGNPGIVRRSGGRAAGGRNEPHGCGDSGRESEGRAGLAGCLNCFDRVACRSSFSPAMRA